MSGGAQDDYFDINYLGHAELRGDDGSDSINVTAVNAHIDEQAMHGELKEAVLDAAGEISRWLAHRS